MKNNSFKYKLYIELNVLQDSGVESFCLPKAAWSARRELRGWLIMAAHATPGQSLNLG